MLFIYPFGIPALYAYLTFRKYRKPLERLKEIEAVRVTLAEQAKAEDKYGGGDGGGGGGGGGGTHIERVGTRLLDLEAEERSLHATLPDFIKKLTSGYTRRVFYFEIVECVTPPRRPTAQSAPHAVPPRSPHRTPSHRARPLQALLVVCTQRARATSVAPRSLSSGSSDAHLLLTCAWSRALRRVLGAGARANWHWSACPSSSPLARWHSSSSG